MSAGRSGPGVDRRPIMIIGISRRCGTNFLGNLLLCHRDCAAPSAPVFEDHLLRHADVLERYATKTARRWPRRWGDRDPARADLERALGAGLLTFVTDRAAPGARAVSRTPHTDNLHLVPRFYGEADVILLIRDGRSVASSIVEAWHWSDDQAIREWRTGARAILDFQRRDRSEEQVRSTLIRYEDLVEDLDASVAELLDFLRLDAGRFDHQRAGELPIVGSSYLRDDEGHVTWTPTPRPASFSPATRHASWSAARHDRFNWLAGAEQQALGYPIEVPQQRLPMTALRHTVRDLTSTATDLVRAGGRRTTSELRDLRHQLLGDRGDASA